MEETRKMIGEMVGKVKKGMTTHIRKLKKDLRSIEKKMENKQTNGCKERNT